jgi:D-alanyl-D-alanine carboxypeptidase
MRTALLSLTLLACTKEDAPAAPGADTAPLDDTAISNDVADDTASPVDALEELLEPIRAANNLPALAGAVFDSNGLLAIGAVGVRKFGDTTAVTRADKWHLGSDTKAMTATLLALYVSEKKIRWEQTIAESFAKEAMSFDSAYKPVTLEALLQHRGGAPSAVPDDLWAEMWKPGDSRTQRRVAVIEMLKRPIAQPVGTYAYANAGYMMAGAALEDALDTAWESSMRTRLFDALGMKTCGFGAPATVSMIDQPWGHTLKSGKPSPVTPGPGADNPPALGPAGTAHCDLADWGKFLILHLRGARGAPTSMLDAAAFKRMHTPPTGADYALGWGVGTRPWAGGMVLTHSGSNTMFYCTAWIAPAKDRIFVAATNIGGDAAAKAVDAAFGPMIMKYAN